MSNDIDHMVVNVDGCLDSMERGTVEWNSGTVEWNSGMVERWNTGMVDRAINDPVPFLLVYVDQLGMRTSTNIDIEKHGWSGYIYQASYLSLENYLHLYKCVKRSLCMCCCVTHRYSYLTDK